MHDEFTAHQRALTLRLSGRPVSYICQALGRSDFWFRQWWRRYLEAGADGLYDLTHATHHIAQRIAPELEKAILSIRRRLQAHATPATRYSLTGAAAILAELEALNIRPLPSARTIERVDPVIQKVEEYKKFHKHPMRKPKVFHPKTNEKFRRRWDATNEKFRRFPEP